MKIDDEKHLKRKRRFNRAKFILSALFCLPLLYLAIVPMLWWLSIPYPSILEPMQYPLSNALAQIALTLPIILVGYRFLFSGLKAHFQRSPNMDTLIAIGSLASIAYSLYSTYQIYSGNFGASDRLYFSTAGAIITLALMGKWLESSTKGCIFKKFRKLAGVDTKAAILETKPSAINQGKRADAVSGYYTAIIDMIAIIAAGAWLAAGQNFPFAIAVFLSVLIVGCPSGLGLAVPAAIAQSSRRGAKRGIFIKGTEAFEAAAKIDTVVLNIPEMLYENLTGETDALPGPTVKEASKKAIRLLQHIGVEVVLMTGMDSQEANAVALKAGISRVLAGIQPQDSVDAVKGLQSEGKKVAMVGSGASDAPALLQANAGIVIGLTTDKAVAASDIVLAQSNLTDVASAIQLCRRTMHIIRGNLFWVFSYHAAGIAVAAGLLHTIGGPLMNPVIAAAAMLLGTVSVFLNTLIQNRKSLQKVVEI